MSSFAMYNPSMGITQDQYLQNINRTNKRLYGSVLSNKTGQVPVANLVPPTLRGDLSQLKNSYADGGLPSLLESSRENRGYPNSSDPYDESQRIMDELRKEYSGPVTQNDIQWRGLGGQGYTPQFIEFAKSKGYEVAMGDRSDAAQYLRPTNTFHTDGGLEPIPDRPPLAPSTPIAFPPTPIAPPKPSGTGGPRLYKPGEIPEHYLLSLGYKHADLARARAASSERTSAQIIDDLGIPPVMPPQPPVMPPQPPVMPRPAGVSSGDNLLGGPRYGRLPTGRDISRSVAPDDPAIRPPSILLKNMRHGGSLTHTVLDILRSLS